MIELEFELNLIIDLKSLFVSDHSYPPLLHAVSLVYHRVVIISHATTCHKVERVTLAHGLGSKLLSQVGGVRGGANMLPGLASVGGFYDAFLDRLG